MKVFVICCLCLWCFCTKILCAKILGLFNIPSNSHNIIGVTLLQNLAERGHQVTIMSELDPDLNHSNIRFIRLKGILENLANHRPDLHKMFSLNIFSYYAHIVNYGCVCMESTLRNNEMQKLIKSDEKFDLIFIEPFFNQALVGLGAHFNAQTIVLSASNSYVPNIIFGNTDVYSFVPDSVSSSYTDRMEFTERFWNTINSVYFHIYNEIYKTNHVKLYKENFPHAVDLDKALRNVSLHFVNTHVMYESPRQYFPNMIPIGGLHLYSTPKIIPKDVNDFLDNAKHGVIYFSFGSFLQSKNISNETKNEIIKTFSKLPQKILWKFEDHFPGLPENVKTSKWFPQNEILGHPNVKLFISHCGQLSTIEAIFNGVPVLGIPLIFDQFSNIARLEQKGYGLKLSFSELTEEVFTAKIKELLENTSYRENIKKASQIVRDQTETPLKRAIFWTEHILKYGSKHLRPASLDLNITEYLLLDVFAFIVFILLFICVITYFVIYLLFKKVLKIKYKTE